ncbi:hypothetical protein ACWD48_28110, partial [Streptomyces sp. NPDC002519]
DEQGGGPQEDPQAGGPQEDPQAGGPEEDPQAGGDAATGGSEGSESDHGEHGAREHQEAKKAPTGGVHAGGGALAQGTSGSGLAAGSILLLGGLGAGAYMLRRRNASGTTGA